MAQAAHAPRVICLINKSDRPLAFAPEELRSRFPHLCVVSAATGAGLDALGETVAALFPAGGAESAGELLTNARQADAARRALEAVTRASESLEAGITPDALLTDAEGYQSGTQGEQVLLQGVVDCCFETADGLTVVDFKTDRVFSALEVRQRAEHYRPQLEAYSRALERVLEKKVVRRALYFLAAGETMEI